MEDPRPIPIAVEARLDAPSARRRPRRAGSAARTCARRLAAAVLVAAGSLATAGDEFVVRQWSQEHGLPQSTINAIAQDRSGYLWLGTFGGLSRFDGVRFVTFDQSDSENSCPNRILDVKCAPDGALWIGSEYAGLWRHHDGRFERWLDGTARSIAIGEDGTVHVVTPGGLWSLRPGETRFAPDPSLPQVRLKHVEVGPDGSLWACAVSALYRGGNGAWVEIRRADGRPVVDAQDLAFDASGAAYVRSESHVGYLAPGSDVVRDHVIAGGEAERLLVDREGTLWTSGGDDLRRYRGTELIGDAGVRGHPKLGSPPLRLRATFEDAEGGLWFGTESSGLFHVQPSRIDVCEETPSGVRTIGPVIEDGDGRIWVGGKDVIARFEHGVLTPAYACPSTIRALGVGSDGTLWATAEQALLRVAPGAVSPEIFPLPERWAPYETALRALWLDPNGDVWFGGTGGVYHRSGDRLERLSVEDGLNSNEVFALTRDSRGDLWIGTDDGLSRLRDGVIESYLSKVNGIPVAVRDIEEDGSRALWLATYGAGLCRFAGGQAEWFTTADGLPDNSLSAVVIDRSGRITVTTNRGVASARLDALERHQRTNPGPPLWSVTTTAAYRPVVEAQGGVQPSAVMTADGSIVFTIVRGLARYRPPRASHAAGEPIARIEEIRAGREALRADVSALPLGARRVTFGYTAPRFIDPDDVRFRYRLLPVDRDWINVGTARAATYQQLAPGDYEFEVAAGTAQSGWSTEVDRTRFTVPAYWYETAFVRWASRAAVLIAIVGWLWSRIQRQKRRALTLRRVVDERTRELAAEIEVRRNAEAELRRHHDDLDARVRERTAELENAVWKLESETAERTRLQGELLHSQKMDSLGRMASGVAHDFNNLLTAINGSAEIGELDASDADASRHAFGVIRHAGEMAAHLTRQLLIFARRHPMRPIQQTFERRIVDTRALLERALGERITLRLELGTEPWPVLLPEGQIEQLLMNVCINARDAMSDGGTITIRTGKTSFSGDDVPNHLAAGEYAELAITDTGVGMDRDTVDHAFDPFFTTKPHGSGLGLSTCYGIARQAGGTMKIESTPGRGTTVRVWLPRARFTPSASTEPVPSAAPPVLDILLVEDREEVRNVVSMMLRSRGHRVIEASSGDEALSLAGDATTTFDAVVLDVMMPGLTGPATALRIRAKRPQVAVVFMSGNVDSERGAADDVVDRSIFLAKPFTAAQLDECIEHAVAAATTPARASGR